MPAIAKSTLLKGRLKRMKLCEGCKYLTPSKRHCRYGVPDTKHKFSYATGKQEEYKTNVFDCTSLDTMRSLGKCGPEATLYEAEETMPFGCFVTITSAIIFLIWLVVSTLGEKV